MNGVSRPATTIKGMLHFIITLLCPARAGLGKFFMSSLNSPLSTSELLKSTHQEFNLSERRKKKENSVSVLRHHPSNINSRPCDGLVTGRSGTCRPDFFSRSQTCSLALVMIYWMLFAVDCEKSHITAQNMILLRNEWCVGGRVRLCKAVEM